MLNEMTYEEAWAFAVNPANPLPDRLSAAAVAWEAFDPAIAEHSLLAFLAKTTGTRGVGQLFHDAMLAIDMKDMIIRRFVRLGCRGIAGALGQDSGIVWQCRGDLEAVIRVMKNAEAIEESPDPL